MFDGFMRWSTWQRWRIGTKSWIRCSHQTIPGIGYVWLCDQANLFLAYESLWIIPSQNTLNSNQFTTNKKHTFDQCQIKLGFMETVSEIVFVKEMKVLMAIFVGCYLVEI